MLWLAAHSYFGRLRWFSSLGSPGLEQMRTGQDPWTVCKAHLGTGTRNAPGGLHPGMRTCALRRPTSGGAWE
nr:hypothetical protein HJG63_000139 [Rousettus aegyptiacus]